MKNILYKKVTHCDGVGKLQLHIPFSCLKYILATPPYFVMELKKSEPCFLHHSNQSGRNQKTSLYFITNFLFPECSVEVIFDIKCQNALITAAHEGLGNTVTSKSLSCTLAGTKCVHLYSKG